MDRELFVATLGVVHALFGKPAPGPAVTQALWDRVASYPDAVLPLFEQRLELAERLPADVLRGLEIIDFGGGFGIPYHKYEGQPRLDMADLAEKLRLAGELLHPAPPSEV